MTAADDRFPELADVAEAQDALDEIDKLQAALVRCIDDCPQCRDRRVRAILDLPVTP